MAGAQFQAAQHEASALGMEDLSGDPPQGFLNTAFRWIDAPRAGVFNALRAGFDPDMGWDEFVDAFREREGFGELSPLVMQEDDSGVQRVLKGGAAFLGDVATDPLILVSWGATVVGKKLGSQAVQKAVSGRVARHLSTEDLRRFASKTFRRDAEEQAKLMGLSDDALKRLQDMEKGVASQLDLGAQAVGDRAAAAFQMRGATGLREFFETEFGKRGKDLWETLPTDIKGGLRIRIPFSRDEGVRSAIALAGGGGQFADRLGLRPVVMKTHEWRGMIRASKAGQGMSKSINGANGDLYGKMVGDEFQRAFRTTDPGERLSGMTYGLYRTLTDAQRSAHLSSKALNQTGNETLVRIQHRIASAGKPDEVEEARSTFHRLVNDPEELDHLTSMARGVEADEQGRLFLDMPDGARELSPAEVLGFESAREYHDTLRHLFAQAVDAGVHITELNDFYLPRALTRAKREQMARTRVPAARRGEVRGTDPRKRRGQFTELVSEMDDEGVVRLRMVHLTNEQANAKAKERARRLKAAGEEDVREEDLLIDFFETDPDVMMSRYAQALAHVSADAKFAQVIRRYGGVAPGDTTAQRRVVPRMVGEAGESLEEAVDTLRLAAPNLPEDQQGFVRHILGDVEGTLRPRLKQALDDLDLTPAEQVQMVDSVMKTMDQHLNILPKIKDVKGALKNARKSYQQARRSLDEGTTRRPELGEISEAFESLGLNIQGVRPDERMTRRLPPELDTTWAPETMRKAINDYYELKGPAGQGIVNRWYRPYLSMFKMTATIGRGPGFHIRNIVGGMWNNHLIGVTQKDNMQAARIVRARVNAGLRARKEVADDTVQKTGRPRHEVTSGQGFEEAVARRAEEILQSRLGRVQMNDDYTLYDVHRMMIDHEIDWRQGRHQALADAAGAGFVRPGVDVMPDRGVVGPIQRRAAQALGIDPEQMRIRGSFSEATARMYPGVAREDLSAGQRGIENLANLWWIRFNAGAAEMSEAYLRGSAFIQGLKQYRDPEVARLLPLSTQFDYQDLSRFERNILRGSLLPFYTWTRYNIPLQMRGLIQQPGKMNRLNLLLDNAEEAFGDDDIDTLPEWMRDRFMFASRFQYDGNPMAFGVETPAQDLNEWFKVGPNGLPNIDATQRMARSFMSALNPAFSVPMQYLSGTEFFTGARLDEHAGRHAPWWYQRLPQRIAPTWVDSDGNIQGDARKIVAGPGAVPWLGQSEKILVMLGAAGQQAGLPVPEAAQPLEGRNRLVSDAVRQLFPVVTTGTLTPQSEAGELFARARRLRTQALRNADPEDQELVQQLRDLGMDLEQISAVMEQVRARRALAGAN